MAQAMQVRNGYLNTQESYIGQMATCPVRPPVRLVAGETRPGADPGLPGVPRHRETARPAFDWHGSCPLRFLYRVTLRKDWHVEEVISVPKQPKRLPLALSSEEVVRFLACLRGRSHHTILTTCYAAGPRISEALRLCPTAIDSQRKVIRIEQGRASRTATPCTRPARNPSATTGDAPDPWANGLYRDSFPAPTSFATPSAPPTKAPSAAADY